MSVVAESPSDQEARKRAHELCNTAINTIELLQFPSGTEGVDRILKDLLKKPFELAKGKVADEGSRVSHLRRVRPYLAAEFSSNRCGQFQVLATKYPFASEGAEPSDLETFTKFFRPGGVLDSFRPQRGAKVDRNLQEFLTQSSPVQAIFFANRSSTPHLKFSLTAYLPPGMSAVRILIHDTEETLKGGGASASFSWPGKEKQEALLALQPTGGGKEITVSHHQGPWALFELLDEGKGWTPESNGFKVSWPLKDRSGSLALVFTDVDPSIFRRQALSQLACDSGAKN